jgi:hypothetical protein
VKTLPGSGMGGTLIALLFPCQNIIGCFDGDNGSRHRIEKYAFELMIYDFVGCIL